MLYFFHVFIKYEEQAGMSPLRPSVQNMRKVRAEKYWELLSFNIIKCEGCIKLSIFIRNIVISIQRVVGSHYKYPDCSWNNRQRFQGFHCSLAFSWVCDGNNTKQGHLLDSEPRIPPINFNQNYMKWLLQKIFQL